MTLPSIAKGPRPSTLPARKVKHPGMSWAALAKLEMKRWGGKGGGVPGKYSISKNSGRPKFVAKTRDKILGALREIERGSAQEVARECEFESSTVWRHLKGMVEDGIVRFEVVGREKIYEVIE